MAILKPFLDAVVVDFPLSIFFSLFRFFFYYLFFVLFHYPFFMISKILPHFRFFFFLYFLLLFSLSSFFSCVITTKNINFLLLYFFICIQKRYRFWVKHKYLKNWEILSVRQFRKGLLSVESMSIQNWMNGKESCYWCTLQIAFSLFIFLFILFFCFCYPFNYCSILCFSWIDFFSLVGSLWKISMLNFLPRVEKLYFLKL